MKAIITAVFALVLATTGLSAPAQAGDKFDAEALVTSARASLEKFDADPEMDWFRQNIKKALGILIIPSMKRGGFIIGGTGGSGVLLARKPGSDNWSHPAFYRMFSATFGLQIGAEVSEVVLMIMTEKALNGFLEPSFKFGGDVSVALGPVGAGARAQLADIYAFSRSKGLYGGINVEGAAVEVRDDLNGGFYGRAVTPSEILIRRTVTNGQANGLRSSASRIGN